MDETNFSGTVLVVTDDPHLREEVGMAFSEDATVVLAADAREAATFLETQIPDVVVVDIQTGSAGGFSLRLEMSQTARLADVPVLMLIERHQDEWLAKQAGAHAIRVKPIELDELVDTITGLAAPHPNAA